MALVSFNSEDKVFNPNLLSTYTSPDQTCRNSAFLKTKRSWCVLVIYFDKHCILNPLAQKLLNTAGDVFLFENTPHCLANGKLLLAAGNRQWVENTDKISLLVIELYIHTEASEFIRPAPENTRFKRFWVVVCPYYFLCKITVALPRIMYIVPLASCAWQMAYMADVIKSCISVNAGCLCEWVGPTTGK